CTQLTFHENFQGII
ncbi:hypothetical protein SLEP1_g60211, partial [Rubroshorea leprosula]